MDNYKIHAPAAPASGTLTLDVMVWALAAGRPRPAGLGVQRGHRHPGRLPGAGQRRRGDERPDPERARRRTDYILSIRARDPGGAHGTGSYFLAADFNQFALTTFDGVASDTLAPAATRSAQLTINEAAVYEFALAASLLQPGSGQGGGVVMTVTDSAGRTVLTLAVDAGQPQVTAARYLATGTYTVTYSYRAVSGKTAAALEYDLFLLEITDGVGPYPSGSTRSGSTYDTPSGGTTTQSGGYTYSGSSTSQPSGNYYYF